VPGPAETLHRRIEERGAIPFADFMEEALYGEGGYYAGAVSPVGRGGDFVTGPSFSALFGRATERLLGRLDRALGRPAEMLEAGYGGGEHLRAMVAAAAAPRRLLAWDRVARPVPDGVERLDRLDRVPAGGLAGLVFSYELFDALPCHRLIGRAAGPPGELWVGHDPDGGFAWVEGELSRPGLADLLPPSPALETGQIADLSPAWAPLYQRLAARLGRGLVVTCDYGFETRRLLDARIRGRGTLACYRRQRVHRNPFVDVGRQDLTAHVDFDILRHAGERAGLETVAFTRQALWLTACGIFDDLAEAGLETRAEARMLLDGAGMGEEIRVLVQARGVDGCLVQHERAPGGTARARPPPRTTAVAHPPNHHAR
jgi:SAM-dependent MidA family methyltransferase